MQAVATTNSDSLLASGIITGSSGDQQMLMLVLVFTIASMPNGLRRDRIIEM